MRTKVYGNKMFFRFLKVKEKNYNRDVFGASLLGIFKVHESYFLIVLYIIKKCDISLYATCYSGREDFSLY